MNNIKNKSVQYSKKMFIGLLGITTWSSCINSVNKLGINEPVFPTPNRTMQINNGTPKLENHSLSKNYYIDKNKEENLNLLNKEVQQGIKKFQMMNECDHENCLRYNSKTHTHSKLCPICMADIVVNPKCGCINTLDDFVKQYGISSILGTNSDERFRNRLFDGLGHNKAFIRWLGNKFFSNDNKREKLLFAQEITVHTNLGDALKSNDGIFLYTSLTDGRLESKVDVLEISATHINLNDWLKKETKVTLGLLDLVISKGKIEDQLALLQTLAKHIDLNDVLIENEKILLDLFRSKNHTHSEIITLLEELSKHINLSELASKLDKDLLTVMSIGECLSNRSAKKMLVFFEDYIRKNINNTYCLNVPTLPLTDKKTLLEYALYQKDLDFIKYLVDLGVEFIPAKMRRVMPRTKTVFQETNRDIYDYLSKTFEDFDKNVYGEEE